MADVSIYDQIAIAVNGTLLTEATTISISYVDSDEVIALLGLTINGAPRRGVVVAPGGRYMVVEISEGVRSAGSDIAVDQLYLDAEEIGLNAKMLGSGRSLDSRGFVKSPGLNTGYGRPLVSAWSFVGYAAAFASA